MARIRTIKPDFFRHYALYAAEVESGMPLRVAFAGLWTVADREGRFKWEPVVLKLDCLPFDDVDFSRVLDALWTRGFLVKYASQGREYGVIPSFTDHQVINNRESDSRLPEPSDESIIVQELSNLTREARVNNASVTPLVRAQAEGKGREGKGTRVPRVSITRDYDWENITGELKAKWTKAYPAVDIDVELAKAAAWLRANPKNRKSNYEKFLVGWLSRAQDRAPRRNTTQEDQWAGIE